MNKLMKQAIAMAAKEALAKRDYSYYFLLANPKSKLYRHTKFVCEKLQKIIDGEQHFYIVEMPPQHGKSLSITKTFPSYYLMRNPSKHVMVSAYSQDLYTQFAASNRRNFMTWSKLFGLKTGKNTANEFEVLDPHGEGSPGSFFATSMLGGASGMPADLLIIDDPIKNSEEAMSPTIKNKIWNEWNMTFYPRLQKGGSVIVIMTRWQKDDLAGRLLQRSSLPWEEIKLPAIAEDMPDGQTDAIGRKAGEPLCPELHDLDELLTHKNDMGTQQFTALYQQSPTVEGGNLFKREWVKYFVPDRQTQARLGLTDKEAVVQPKIFDELAQSWDATFKDSDSSDYVAGQVWARRDADYYLMDWVHERLSFVQTLSAIRSITTKWPKAKAKYIEDKANGSAIIDTLKHEIGGIIPVTPDGGKIVRASAVSPLWEAGNVYVPHPLWKPGVEDLLQEIFEFPNAAHDDYVDAMTQALNYIKKHKKVLHRFGRT
ncbi:phage terminase large subunit [Lactobacillus delbrueckii subsp. lactis]|uniref:phage terminase large subunit n=1 Tax=Lactobacillus delbrueckii TaxID=1584 RepID=UPI001E316601|nr:phage terminase large subunit [Lactobacillus delbrueckii]MCD5528920.1 phage terminase large subunit [Lactobacillus delbrueckii subsp. lactis]MCS8607337.1 terminase [Lactobacillus delbrueckii subsp. lactis]